MLRLTQSRFIRLFWKRGAFFRLYFNHYIFISTISRDHQVGFFDCLSFFTRTEESSDSSRSNSPAPANEGKIEFITEFGGENSDAPEVKGSDKTTVTNKHTRSVYTICYFKSFIYQRVLRPF